MKEKLLSFYRHAKKPLIILYVSTIIISTILFSILVFHYVPDIDCMYLGEMALKPDEAQSLLNYAPAEDISVGTISSAEKAAQTAYDTWKAEFSTKLLSSVNMPYFIYYIPNEDLWYVHSTLSQYEGMENWVTMGNIAHIYIRGRDGKVISVYYG